MFAELERLIAQRVLAGDDLDTIEEEIIDRCPLDEEQRAVLWLYAEALHEQQSEHPRHDRAPAPVGS